MVTASIVTFYGDRDVLSRLIDCVLRSSVDVLYVIDHTPDDGYVPRCQSDRVVYIRHRNNGYGGGHNVAIRLAMEAGADYHAVLNPDLYWTGDVIGSLRDFMDSRPDVGQVMPRIYSPEGELQYLCKMIPTPVDLLMKRFLPRGVKERRMARFQLKFADYDREMNVPYLSGCFMFFRVSALREVGLFDERFFMYPEDIDITRRMHRRYKTVYNPAVSVVHLYEAASYRNMRMMGVHIVNMVRYFNKWGWFFDSERRRINRRLLTDLSK